MLPPTFVLASFLCSIRGLCATRTIITFVVVGSETIYIYWELRSCTTLALGGANLSRQASTADLGKHMIEKGDESMSLLGSTVRDCCLNLRYVFILWVVGL